MTKKRVLVVEDEELMRNILRRLLEDSGYDVLSTDSAEGAIRLFSKSDISVTLTDIKMAGMDGIELLDRIKSVDDTALVIIMTAYSSVDSAIAALRKGAFDYITKPFVNDDLLKTVENAISQRELFIENRALRRELNRQFNFDEIVGGSGTLETAIDLAKRVADTDVSVLIRGETGTGKELFARALHFNSGRAAKPFLAVNCGAFNESLLESELFGHVKGSFTGAMSNRDGLFRFARGGSIFLDEIGEMPATLQVKLLRALQEREITPVGSSTAVTFDARIIAATHRDLETEITVGGFREDLYYRLNVVEIPIPPLRERQSDIPPLVKHFISRIARKLSLPEKPVSDSAIAALTKYDWPGNVRELENAMERAFILSDAEIDLPSLPAKIVAADASRLVSVDEGLAGRSLEEVEKKYVREVLGLVSQDKVKAAKILGIDLSTLYRKLRRYEEM